jgi:RNA polymerase sigma-70 factor, ECF subfamily
VNLRLVFHCQIHPKERLVDDNPNPGMRTADNSSQTILILRQTDKLEACGASGFKSQCASAAWDSLDPTGHGIICRMESVDTDLLNALQRGDDSAIEELLRRYQSRIYRYGMRMCGDPEDAKDVLQDTLLTMTRSLRSFRGASSLSTWLYAIARSLCLKKRRKSKFAPAEELSLSGMDSDHSGPVGPLSERPDHIVNARELGNYLNKAVQALDPIYRDVLLLRDGEGLSAAEVASVLGISVDAVKSRLHRARLAVRDQMAPLVGVLPKPVTAASRKCPDVLLLFSRHLENEIDPEICKTMEQHLAECSGCRDDCESLKKTLALCSSSPEVSVPVQVQESVRQAIRTFLRQPSH